jgi:predicted deacylase
MLKSFAYSAEEKGPRLLILGAVHGNEICGTLAIRRVMEELDSGKISLTHGRVEFVPVANPRAHESGKRFIERNLNRYFLPVEEPKTYEAKLNNILCPMIEACDVLIDLHSTTAGGIPFASVEGVNEDENKLAAAMGAEVLLYGWDEAYAASGRTNPDPDESVGTTAYARRHGAKMAVLLECGQHKDPAAVEIAYTAIRNALRHLGMVEDGASLPRQSPPVIRTTLVVYRGEGGAFTESWSNFSPVKAGQKVALRQDGVAVTAPADGFIVLPTPHTPAGSEWFYFGEKV